MLDRDFIRQDLTGIEAVQADIESLRRKISYTPEEKLPSKRKQEKQKINYRRLQMRREKWVLTGE